MNIQAVLYDCDGLMFDTERVSQNMWRQIAAEYNVTIPEWFFKAITGTKRGDEILAYEKDIPHLKEIMTIERKKRFDLDFWSQFYPDGLNKKGLVHLQMWLEQKKIHTAVCSSSNRDYVETLIHTVSVPLHFETIIGGDMVTKGKPDPEIFLKGAEALSVPVENCLVLEDSKQGIIAAHRAGMHSCFIEDTIEPDEEMKQAIEFQKNSLDEVIDLIRKGR